MTQQKRKMMYVWACVLGVMGGACLYERPAFANPESVEISESEASNAASGLDTGSGKEKLSTKKALIQSLIKSLSNSKWATQKFCRKGNAIEGVFSVRSAGGAACTIPLPAALAETFCGEGDIEGYNGSHCAGYAKETVNAYAKKLNFEGTDQEKAQKVAQKEISKLASSLLKKICKNEAVSSKPPFKSLCVKYQ